MDFLWTITHYSVLQFTCKSLLIRNFFEHKWHSKFKPPFLWNIRLWLSKERLFARVVSHKSHFTGSELCVIICLSRYFFSAYHPPQTTHCTFSFGFCGFFKCTVWICFWSPCLYENRLAQYSQISSFSVGFSLCVSKWMFNRSCEEKLRKHINSQRQHGLFIFKNEI